MFMLGLKGVDKGVNDEIRLEGLNTKRTTGPTGRFVTVLKQTSLAELDHARSWEVS